MPHPCIGSCVSVLRIKRSSVPWIRSVGLLTKAPLTYRQVLYAAPVNSQGEKCEEKRRVALISLLTLCATRLTGLSSISPFKNPPLFSASLRRLEVVFVSA